MWEVVAASAGANIVGGLLGAQGAKDAANIQADATRSGIAENQRQFDLSRADLAPYRDAGKLALADINAGLGVRRGASTLVSGRPIAREDFDAQAYLAANPDIANSGNQAWKADPYLHYQQEGMQAGSYRPAYKLGAVEVDPNAAYRKKFTMEDFQNDPVTKASFEFGLSEGEKAVKRMFGAKGMSRSGAAVKALTRFGTDYGGTKAGESYNRFYADQDRAFNRSAAVAGIGQTASTTTAGLGANAATNTAGMLTAEGNARGAAAIARSNAIGGAVNNIGNTMMGQYTLGRILNGGAGYSAGSPTAGAPRFTMDSYVPDTSYASA